MLLFYRPYLCAMKQPAERPLAMLLLLAILITTGGCQPSTSGKLQGRWTGRPDTQAARSLREAKKYGDATDKTSDPKTQPSRQTDWERYDVAVEFHFISSSQLEMSLADGSQLRKGTWEILKTLPTGCRIEVKIDEASQLRQFELQMDEKEGRCVGFLLSEVGADPQLGWLYFQRTEGM